MRIDLDGRALQVEVHESRSPGTDRPDVVCLHGLADTAAIWRRIAPELSERARLIAFDQRAHGSSDGGTTSLAIADLAADVVALLDRLNVDRALLVGHSMGGVVAMTTALAAPERIAGLVLLGTTSQVSARTAAWYGRIAAAADEDGLEGLRRSIFGEKSKREIHGDARGLASLTRSLARLHAEPLTPRLGKIAVPTVVLVGDRDPMGTAASEIIARHLPAARLEVVPGGHWLHLESAERVVGAVEGLLASLSHSRVARNLA